ncbi:MAG: hypothetical protein ACRDRI_27265 [Pseudonocardiaceae bacterium]
MYAGIASKFKLPGDEWIKCAKRLVQFTGIVAGAASGQPLLVNACVKSLVHDLILECVSTGIKARLSTMLEPAGARESLLPRPSSSQSDSSSERNE